MRVGVLRNAPAALPSGKDPVPIVQEAGWAAELVWAGAENLAPPTGIRSPDLPTRSESLYWLSYRGPIIIHSPFLYSVEIIRLFLLFFCGAGLSTSDKEWRISVRDL